MRVSFIIVFAVLFCFARGQNYTPYFPVQFSQYVRHYPFINPSAIGIYSNYEANLGSKNHIGNFSNIATYFANVNVSLKKTENVKSFSSIGLRADTDKEGKYISRSRAYIMYAFHFTLFNDYYLSGGIDFGMLNLSVKGTPSTGDKSEFIPDANSGLCLHREDFYFGISLNQVFNGRLQPYQEISILRRHYQVSAMKIIKVNELLSIKPSFLFRIPSYLPDNYNADYSIEMDLAGFLGGFSLRHKLGGAFWLGIDKLKLAQGSIELVVTYNTPFGKSVINLNDFEIVCRYKFID